MGLFMYFTFFVVLFYGVQNVDSEPNKYCGGRLADELERRCRTKGYNGPQRPDFKLFGKKNKFSTTASLRSNQKNIIDECCHSACTDEILDSYCLSPTPKDDTIESETMETTTIVNTKKQRTKKPKPTRKSGRKNKGGSDTSEESASDKDYETKTENPRNKNGREKNKNKDKNKKNKCNKITLTDRYGNPCVRKSKERKEKDRSQKNRKRNKKNKPTRRPKRWDSETTTLSEFLQDIYNSDFADKSNIDEIKTGFDIVPEGDPSSSVSQEESSSNEVIPDAQRTEPFRPPYKHILVDPIDMDSYDNMFMNSDDLPVQKVRPRLDDPEDKIKKLTQIFSAIVHDSTRSPKTIH